MSLEEETINNQTFCRECGESIEAKSKFCPQCGANQNPTTASSEETESGLFSSLNKYELIVLAGSAFMFAAVPLPWATNPLASATGVEVGYGYLTLIGSIIIAPMIILDVVHNAQGAISFAIGVIIIFATFLFIGNVLDTTNLYIGFGCLLALIGAIMVTGAGLRLDGIARSEVEP